MEVAVTGIGLRSSLGSLKRSWKRLLLGESGIASCQPFSRFSPTPLALIQDSPVSLSFLIEDILQQTLEDAHLTIPLEDCGVVIGSSRGYQGQLEQLVEKQIFCVPNSPDLFPEFSQFLPNQVSTKVAYLLRSHAPILSPMAACATGLWSIAQGFELIKQGYCQRVIVGALDAPITPLILTGFHKIGALAKEGCYPFDRKRDGFILGEGGAFFILEEISLAQTRKAKIYGKILGFSFSNDAYSMTAPELGGKMAQKTIKTCLQKSQLFPHQIDYIHAHGTGTLLNDHHEALLIQQIFSPAVFVSSTKGATGHTLGGSGALGVAFSLMSLSQKILPPCVGLRQPAFDLNFVTIPQEYPVKNVLCFSFGFGGQNAVMALSS